MYTDIRSAEMIKYASNAFLSTKISFINEIASICEKVGANIESVASGMGMDSRIGSKFLQAGIGYGGSCFPKDTKALVQIAGNVDHEFDLLKSVISVNNKQQIKLVEKALWYYGDQLHGKRAAILGLAFKPNTNDIREAASIKIIQKLLQYECQVSVYDPVAMPNFQQQFPDLRIEYCNSYQEAMIDSDFLMLVTEWDEFKQIDLAEAKRLIRDSVIFDGRNCLNLDAVQEFKFDYFSIGRPAILAK
jgi:UDPglucose 6-dehydrogenase